jgi:hypothetical protein
MAAEVFDQRTYNDYPYLVVPASPLRIKLGTVKPRLRAFVRQRTNLFGDAEPLELAGLNIRFTLFNKNNVAVANGPVTITNLATAEIEYIFSEFDIREYGVHTGEFTFIDIDESKFTLPFTKDRIQIIVF